MATPAEQDPFLGAAADGQKESRCDAKRCGACCCVTFVLTALLVWAYLHWQSLCIGPLFHDENVNVLRPASALEAEAARREAAIRGKKLLTVEDLPNVLALAQNSGVGFVFPNFNFVQGFRQPGCLSSVRWFFSNLFGMTEPRWKPPVEGETVGVVSYDDYSRRHFGHGFGMDFFQDYFTGDRIPSWEDNAAHEAGVNALGLVVKAGRAAGIDPITQVYPVEPRVAFDNQALVKMASDGFRYFGPMEIKYASNGFYGASVVERRMEGRDRKDMLGMLMTESVFGAHLRHDRATGKFHVDLSSMAKYTPIPGYAALGGKATFERDGSRLRTVKLEYNGSTYEDFDVPAVDEAYEQRNSRTGWRMAEGAFIASLLSMTNLVMHVKDLHLEVAAAFQAVTVDAFANRPKHPVRRLLDAFISRSVQATNDNFRLLFDYHAADFSLAPLPHDEQLKLIDEAIQERPLNLADMDMERYGQVRNMDPAYSTKDAITNSSRWGWRWHYRALTVQRLLTSYINCFLDAEGVDEAAMQDDDHLKDWWLSMIHHLPAVRRATQENPDWATPASELSRRQFARVVSTIMVWVSWIHEDVGHSAAAYVYNPVYTPMCVPEDGVGVPLASWVFNALAYRGFVFLHRSVLMDEPPAFWFDGNAESQKCYTDFQDALRSLGEDDIAFSQCDQDGFYSCVNRVETAVSS